MNKDEEDELLEKLAKEMMKNGSITSAFDVEEKTKEIIWKNNPINARRRNE